MSGVIVSPDESQQRWSIANHLVECVIEHAAGRLRWSMRSYASPDLLLAPTPLANMTVDGRPVEWTTLANLHQIEHDGGIHEARVEAQTADHKLRLIQAFEVFPGTPFVRRSGSVENLSPSPIMITGSDLLQLVLHSAGPLTVFHVEQFSWMYRHDFFSQHQMPLVVGRAPLEIRMGSFPSHYGAPSSCAWFAVRTGAVDRPGGDPHAGIGLVAGIEFNGKSRLRAWAAPDHTQIVSTIDDLRHVVQPGATFELPAVFFGFFCGDWDEAGYVTQRFAERYVHPPLPDDRYPWVQYNSWRYEQDIHEEQQLAAIERCAELGIEVVVLDLGWAVQIGNWRHDPAKFPNGLRPLADRAHARGMRFGVHLPLAQVHVDAPVAREHPDWLIHDGDDYYGAAPLCLGHQPARDWLVAQIVQLIDDYGIEYIVQDGEDMIKLCPKQTHTHAPGDSNYANSMQGLDQVIATVRQLRPQLVWENCEDGGCMMTYRMARLCHSSITVDNIATYATRQGIYGASYPFSPRYSARYMQDDPTPYSLRSAIFGGPLILMHRVTDWDATQIAATRAAIAEYKALRTLIREAKVIHLLPPAHHGSGAGQGWDAIQAVAADQQRSVVLVYRARGGSTRQTIRPRGLDEQRLYQVRRHDAGAVTELPGLTIAREGIDVELPELASELISITAC